MLKPSLLASVYHKPPELRRESMRCTQLLAEARRSQTAVHQNAVHEPGLLYTLLAKRSPLAFAQGGRRVRGRGCLHGPRLSGS